MNTNALSTTSSNADFFKTLSTFQGGNETPRPTYIRLDGKSGMWHTSSFNQTEKKQEKKPWKGGGAWDASILLVRWFAKEKYKEGYQGPTRRTREFADWNDEIKLLSINWDDKENKSSEIAIYPSYHDFKDAIDAEFAQAVNVAILEKKQIPNQKDFQFDLWASAYCLDLETNRIVNVKLKGVSRKGVFDYLRNWKKAFDGVDSISQIATRFDIVEFTEPQKYYAAKFVPERVLDEGEQERVRQAILELLAWQKSFEKEETETEKTEVLDENGQSIPF